MILETAILTIKAGQSAAFETAIGQARSLIAATPGFRKIEVRPCVETEGRYLLLVWWDSVEAHTVGFRQSDRYPLWREALHRFYEPFPLVEHYGEPLF